MLFECDIHLQVECDMLRFPISLIVTTALLQAVVFVISDSSFDYREPAGGTLNASQLRCLSRLRESITGIERDLKTLLGLTHVRDRGTMSFIAHVLVTE
jgi:hypothetical protein